MNKIGGSLSALLGLFAVTAASGQSMNIAIGPPGVTPSDTYAAAGLPGYWNGINTANGSTTFNLKDLNGNVTPVSLDQLGGTQVLSLNDPATSGDDETLMDHCLLTYSATLETCLFINDLQPGTYEVLIYAWMPAQPSVRAYTNCDEEPGNPHLIVGGAWPGQQEELVTYARHICVVTTGLLRAHSGIVPGDDPALGAAANGIQLRKLDPVLLGDANCDGDVNGLDISLFAEAVIDPAAYQAAHPLCPLENSDLNLDSQVDTGDISRMVNALLTQ